MTEPGPASTPPARRPTGCMGCLGFLIVTVADLIVMVDAAVRGRVLAMIGAIVVWALILPAACWYRGIPSPWRPSDRG